MFYFGFYNEKGEIIEIDILNSERENLIEVDEF